MNPLWPVIPNKNEYWHGVGGKPPIRETALRGVAEEYRKLIDDFQPDPGDENHPLFIVNRLSNADKHRTLHVSVVAPEQADLVVTPNHPGFRVKWNERIREKGLNDGVELYRWRIEDPAFPRLEVDVKSAVSFDVAFGNRPTYFRIARSSCRFAYEAVRQIFDPLFAVSAF